MALRAAPPTSTLETAQALGPWSQRVALYCAVETRVKVQDGWDANLGLLQHAVG